MDGLRSVFTGQMFTLLKVPSQLTVLLSKRGLALSSPRGNLVTVRLRLIYKCVYGGWTYCLSGICFRDK